jgi:hypothetical protein
MKRLKPLFRSAPACWVPAFRCPLITPSRPSTTMKKPITLTGNVTKVSPDNPHRWIYPDVKNDKRTTAILSSR